MFDVRTVGAIAGHLSNTNETGSCSKLTFIKCIPVSGLLCNRYRYTGAVLFSTRVPIPVIRCIVFPAAIIHSKLPVVASLKVIRPET
jgi:hypothetical protein